MRVFTNASQTPLPPGLRTGVKHPTRPRAVAKSTASSAVSGGAVVRQPLDLLRGTDGAEPSLDAVRNHMGPSGNPLVLRWSV